MSAFIVSKAHIDALVRAALRPRDPLTWFDCDPDTLTYESYEQYQAVVRPHFHTADYNDADRIGRMLWQENLNSVAARYPRDTSGNRPGPVAFTDDDVAAYTYSRTTPYREPVAVLKAINCYEYQSCEHEGWRQSEAYRFCEALKSAMIAALPGYDEAAWEITGAERVPA